MITLVALGVVCAALALRAALGAVQVMDWCPIAIDVSRGLRITRSTEILLRARRLINAFSQVPYEEDLAERFRYALDHPSTLEWI